jgi:hypothetical protein
LYLCCNPHFCWVEIPRKKVLLADYPSSSYYCSLVIFFLHFL